MVFLEIFINCMLYSAIYHSDKIAMATDIPYKMKSCYLLSECRRQSTLKNLCLFNCEFFSEQFEFHISHCIEVLL